MDHRPILQSTLEKIPGIKKVYFDPPKDLKMEYPCIKFSLDNRSSVYANNKRYINGESYVITFITNNVRTAISVCEKLEEIPYMDFDRPYIADGLHHYVYTKTY